MVKIGVCGKPSSGKSTFFSAATMVDVPRAAYPFTTIKPNVAMAAVTTKCACQALEGITGKCKGRNSKCVNGVRHIPVQLVDVAGLVPGAHLGKGMGNEFLNDLIDAEALVHVIDLSGKTDEKGEPAEEYDPEKDILWLQDEIDFWIEKILEKNWKNILRKAKTKPLWECVFEQVSGLSIDPEKVKKIVGGSAGDPLELARKIRSANKPLVLAGNKIDLESSKKNYNRLKKKYDIIPVSAEAELALRKAQAAGIIEYNGHDFRILKKVSSEQEAALEKIRETVIEPYGSTGVQEVLNKTVFEKLGYIVVYPVEDEKKYTDQNGNVLPDAILLKKGSRVIQLAEKVHTDLAKGFIAAVDCRTKRKVGKDHVLSDSDVISIKSRT